MSKWTEKFRDGPTPALKYEADKYRTKVVKAFKVNARCHRLVRFNIEIDRHYSYQSTVKAELFDGDKWNEIDFIYGTDSRAHYENDIKKLEATMQEHVQMILEVGG